MEAYKIFDVKDDMPHTLFHGVNGSRRLQLDQRMFAENKKVRDGSGKRWYKSGFHAYVHLKDAAQWARGAKNLDNRVAVKVSVTKCRYKPNAVRPTLLAATMCVYSKDWKNRIPLKELVNA